MEREGDGFVGNISERFEPYESNKTRKAPPNRKKSSKLRKTVYLDIKLPPYKNNYFSAFFL